MNNFKKIFGTDYIKVKLSLLWLFVMLNYIYADILTLMDSSALKEILGGTQIPSILLLLGAFLMEIPIALVFLSLILKDKWSRIANIIGGTIKSLAVFATLFVGTPVMYYSFFAIVEIITTITIVVIAWRWKK